MGVSLLMKKPIQYLSNPKVKIIDIKPSISTQIKIYYLIQKKNQSHKEYLKVILVIKVYYIIKQTLTYH